MRLADWTESHRVHLAPFVRFESTMRIEPESSTRNSSENRSVESSCARSSD